jgi:hypothetical protein
VAVIGFRCYGDALAYVVLDGAVDDPVLVEHDHLRMPRGDRPQQLAWARKEVQEIAQRTAASGVAYKAAEPVARTKDLARAEAEGVLQEALADLGLTPIRRIKKQIKSDIGFAGPAGELEAALTGPLAELPANRREAALAALAAFAHA